jgi:hypothetical protein
MAIGSESQITIVFTTSPTPQIGEPIEIKDLLLQSGSGPGGE